MRPRSPFAVKASAFAAAALIAFAGSASQAQVRLSVESSSISIGGPGMVGGDGTISRKEAEGYGKALGLSPEQMEGVVALQDGYQTAVRAARKANREAMNDLMRSSEDTGDHSVWLEKMPALRKTLTETTERLEKEFFSDLRTIAACETSDPRWASVERARRRMTTLRGGLAGESIDLIRVVESLKLPEDVGAALKEPLGAYELDLDRALQAKQELRRRAAAIEPGKGISDPEQMTARMKESKEAGMKVREVNTSHARRIASVLPEESRKLFEEEVRRQSFPRVYRQSRVEKDIEAAMKLDDTDARQREELQALLDAYRRDSAPVNRSWADAILESEKNDQSGMFVGPGGEAIAIRMGDEDEGLKNARSARRELDDATREKLNGKLRPGQKEKLPKPTGPQHDGDVLGIELIEGEAATTATEVIMIRE